MQLKDIESVNSHQNPPVLLTGFLCLEEVRKPEQRVDSVLESLFPPPVSHYCLTEETVGDGCEASLVFLHHLHQPGRSLLFDVSQTLSDGLTFLKQLEQLDPPDMDDLCRERQDGLGLQWDPGEATHQPVPVIGGWAATAPAEPATAGTTHVVAAVKFLPGLPTAGAGPDLDLGLQAGLLPHHPAVVVEGVDV